MYTWTEGALRPQSTVRTSTQLTARYKLLHGRSRSRISSEQARSLIVMARSKQTDLMISAGF